MQCAVCGTDDALTGNNTTVNCEDRRMEDADNLNCPVGGLSFPIQRGGGSQPAGSPCGTRVVEGKIMAVQKSCSRIIIHRNILVLNVSAGKPDL